MSNGFLEALKADGPDPTKPGDYALYGWLIGAWSLDVTHFSPDGTPRRRDGEWHFGWTLEGRAIQDVWIVPPRGARHADAVASADSYGTTLRIPHPGGKTWQIQWSDPVRQNFLTMIGRKEGHDIVQLGTRADGEIARWRFLNITSGSFLWRAEVSHDGQTWRTEVTFDARRRRA